MLTHSCRCTLLNRKTHTALSAASTSPTRSPNTRRERTPPLLRVRDATTPSKPVSVDRPSPSSERRPRPPRRLPSSLSATSARSADARSLVDASHSFLERKKTPRVKSFSDWASLSRHRIYLCNWLAQKTTRTSRTATDFPESPVACCAASWEPASHLHYITLHSLLVCLFSVSQTFFIIT